jgi:hypothetical protein
MLIPQTLKVVSQTEKIVEEPRGSFPKTMSIIYKNKIEFISIWKMLTLVIFTQISLAVSSLQTLLDMNNYNNQQTHMKRRHGNA